MLRSVSGGLDQRGAGARVALLSPCFWPEVRRGTERAVHELATGLGRRGWQAEVLSSHPRRFGPGIEAGVRVRRVWRPPQALALRRGYEPYLTHLPLSWLALRAGGYGLAHAMSAGEGAVAARWTATTGRPSVFSYHGIPTRPWLLGARLRLRLTLQAARGCGAVVANSRRAAAEFERTLGVEARVIYPPVDLDSLRPPAARSARPTIVCAAAPDQWHKRLDLVREAFAAVRRERKDARLILVASPAWSEKLGGPGIEVVPPVEDAGRLASVYGQAWASVLASEDEPFGLVLAEALACGTPVVGARSGGVPEVLGDDPVGALFRPGDAGDLARALLDALELAEDPRTAVACRRRAERFSTGRCVDEHEALYRELLSA